MSAHSQLPYTSSANGSDGSRQETTESHLDSNTPPVTPRGQPVATPAATRPQEVPDMPGWKSNSRGPRSRGVPKAVADHVMARDHYECQARLHGCAVIANEVDHVVPVFEGGNDELENLRAICSSCHRKKTAGEAARARQRRRQPVWARPHPGLL